ncbi:MAG: hypothetical protein SNI32_08410 [Rikenellaceae bacterium]
MKKLKSLLLLSLTLAAFVGCSKSDTPPLDGDDGIEGAKVVVVANSSSALTKAAFADQVPLTLYIYLREDAEVMNTSTTPYKIATATGDGSSATHTFLVDDETLTVATCATYDFVIVADAPTTSSVANGVLSSVVNGDVFYGDRQTIAVAEGAESIQVTFGDNGDLPHLTTGVSVNITATDNFLTAVDSENKTVDLSFAYADFGSYPTKSSLNFSSDPFAISTITKSNYTLKGDGTATTITTENNDDAYASYDGYMLPYPLAGASTYNEVDIDFYIGVGEGESKANVMLEAKAVQLPAFEANYRYTFTMEMDADAENNGKVSLYLSITDWDTSSWDSAMGGTDGSFLNIYVGGWSSVSWNSGMGGSAEDKLITSITGWSSASWTSSMGGTNKDNGTNN